MSEQEAENQFTQVQDFLDECNEIYDLVKDLSKTQLNKVTAFKSWTINEVIAHLHIWNMAAAMSLERPDDFKDFIEVVNDIYKSGGKLKDFEEVYLSIRGQALVALWRQEYLRIAEAFHNADPAARVEWAGPSMSVRSSITARLMETWAHGQEIYDVLGVVRKNTDRIKNIVVLGVITFPFTYRVRHEDVPGPMPYVELIAPSGKVWIHGEENENEFIHGSAEEFCQVVTQTRNIADTNLIVNGEIANDWMSKAQCFAGGAEKPPKPGKRKIKIKN